jgi:hypothetical protein
MVRLARRILAETRRAEEELDRLASPGAGSVAVGADTLRGQGERLGVGAPERGARDSCA